MRRGLKGVAYNPPLGGLLIIVLRQYKTKKGQQGVEIRLREKRVGVLPEKRKKMQERKMWKSETKLFLRKFICASLLWLLSIATV